MLRIAIRLGVLALLLSACASLAKPPKLIGASPVPCPDGVVVMEMYDSDGDPKNGAEFVSIADETGKVLAKIYFSDGAEGKFLRAEVGREVYTNVDQFNAKYPHPCALRGIRA